MQDSPPSVSVRLPATTIITVLCALLLVHVTTLIAPLFLPLLIAILIAVSITPLIDWLERRRLPRSLAIGIVTVAMGLMFAVLLYAILPSVYRQGMAFFESLPELKERLLKRIGLDNPLYESIQKGLQSDNILPKAEQMRQVLMAGNLLFGGFAEVILIFVMSIYLAIEGPRIIVWLSAFFSPAVQKKIVLTQNELGKIISAYVFGQFVTSLLSFLFVLVTLLALGVPNALLLGTLAGLLDILPVLGFFLAVIPAMLFAASVSANMPWIVLAAYLFYHTVENYLIVPLVYGKRMRVSSFVVFFTLIAAGLVGGIEGAIVVLPIVASYPIVERIWLRHLIRKEALVEHSAKDL